MAEPPAKRARRTDSSAMWDTIGGDHQNKRLRSVDPDSDLEPRASRQGSAKPTDDYRKRVVSVRDNHVQSQRRYRSRSPRERSDRNNERWRGDRSRSGERRRRDRDRLKDRDRDRSLSRDRGHDRRGYAPKPERYDRSKSPTGRIRNGRKRTRSRSHSPPLRSSKSDRRDPRGDRSNGTSVTKGGPRQHAHVDSDGERDVNMKDDGHSNSDAEVDPDDIEAVMRKTMGFTRFRSTQNTKVPGNNISGVRKEKKIQYRQYMNRVGGFNRPLSPTR